MGVYNASGTRQTRSGLPVTLYTDPDPVYVVNQNLYEKRAFPFAEDPGASEGSEYILVATAGSLVRSSTMTSWFTTADITTVSPSTGVAAAGGATITLTGDGLDGVTAVSVGGTAATNVTVVSPSKVTFTAPAKAAGTYTITLTDDSGTVTKTNAITFV